MFARLRFWIASRLVPIKASSAEVDFRALAENSLDLIVRLGPDQIATYASPSAKRMLGIEPEEIVGRSHMSFVLDEDLPVLEDVIARHLAGEQDARATFRMRRKDGSVLWVEGSGRMIAGDEPEAAEFIVVMRDVSERKALEERLAELALTDALTGLANRRAFDNAFDAEWRRAKRAGTPLSLLMIDLDCFKAFNDHYGHPTGDDCLRGVAAAIRQVVRRSGDVTARYGGEELAIILPNTQPGEAIRIGEAVRGAVEALRIPHVDSPASAFVSVSIGAATALPRRGVPQRMPDRLLSAADAALYRAKEKGRNRVESGLLLTSNQAEPGSKAAA